jgi:hypothetical protein
VLEKDGSVANEKGFTFQRVSAHLTLHPGTELQLIRPAVAMAHVKSVASKSQLVMSNLQSLITVHLPKVKSKMDGVLLVLYALPKMSPSMFRH